MIVMPIMAFSEEWLKGYERGFKDAILKMQIDLKNLSNAINNYQPLSCFSSTADCEADDRPQK